MRFQKVTVLNPIEYFPVTDVSSPRKTPGFGAAGGARGRGARYTLKMNVMSCFLALCMIRFANNFLMKSFKNNIDVKSEILFPFNNIDPLFVNQLLLLFLRL